MKFIICLSLACILAFFSIEPASAQISSVSSTGGSRPFAVSNLRYGVIRRVRVNPDSLPTNTATSTGTNTGTNYVSGTNTGTGANVIPIVISARNNRNRNNRRRG